MIYLSNGPVTKPADKDRVKIGWSSSGPIFADEMAERSRVSTVRLAPTGIADALGDIDAFIDHRRLAPDQRVTVTAHANLQSPNRYSRSSAARLPTAAPASRVAAVSRPFLSCNRYSTVSAVGRLVLDRRVPPRVVMDHRIGRGEVQAAPSRFQADQENWDRPRLKTADRVGSIAGGAGQLDIVDFSRRKSNTGKKPEKLGMNPATAAPIRLTQEGPPAGLQIIGGRKRYLARVSSKFA